MTKILYSPDYGAGWSTWNSGEVARKMLTYQPIVDFIEGGGRFDRKECGSLGSKAPLHPLLLQLQAECLAEFGENYVCVLGADGLTVADVSGSVKINEYDGSESIDQAGYDGWYEL